ncbi:MAG: hypothetical protein M3176_00020 [Chloroflexota bacterium]|nr:hypothetical protein [Chloroflexota bacterium]
MEDLKVNPFRDGDPDYQLVGRDGKVYPGGETIAEWRRRLGGDEGYVAHPLTKRKLRLSLKPYAHLDPEKTRLQMAFHNPHNDPARTETASHGSAGAAKPFYVARQGKRVAEFLKKKKPGQP